MSDFDFFSPPPQPQPPPAPRRGLPTGCWVGAGLAVVALIAAAVIVAAAIQSATRGVTAAAEAMNPANIAATVLAERTPTVVARPPAITQVRALADLTTSSLLMSTIVEADKARVGNIVREKLVLLACGRVKAGIDLSKLQDSDVRASPDGVTVTVRLPKAEILDTYLIDDTTEPCTTRVYDRTNLILLPATKDLESQAREQAVNAIRETALQSGVLREAERNAQTIIERVLLLAGYQIVVFVEE